MKFNSIVIGFFLVFCCVGVSCESTLDTYWEFVSDGETIYIGAVDTVLVQPALNKLRFRVAINADPKASKGLITANNTAISEEFPIVRTRKGKDTIDVDLTLEEREYVFNVILLDDIGNKSISKEVIGKVYGLKYRSELLNRRIETLWVTSKNAVIKFGGPVEGLLYSVIVYEDAKDSLLRKDLPNDTSELILESYKLGGKIRLSGFYRPVANALEDFESIPIMTSFPKLLKADKSLIKPLRLKGDASDDCVGSYENLLDDDESTVWHGCDGENDVSDQYPFVMSFDLGVYAKLGSLQVHPLVDCCEDRLPSSVQLWGIRELAESETISINGDDNGNGDASDIESWESEMRKKGWHKIHEAQGDLLHGVFEINVPETVLAYKYIRIAFLSALSDRYVASFSELTFLLREIDETN